MPTITKSQCVNNNNIISSNNTICIISDRNLYVHTLKEQLLQLQQLSQHNKKVNSKIMVHRQHLQQPHYVHQQ